MSLEKRIAIATASFNNTDRTLIESYSTSHMLERMKESALLSTGHDAFETVQPQRRSVILVTGHFGNDEAPRAALVARRFKIDGLYRNKSNP